MAVLALASVLILLDVLQKGRPSHSLVFIYIWGRNEINSLK